MASKQAKTHAASITSGFNGQLPEGMSADDLLEILEVEPVKGEATLIPEDKVDALKKALSLLIDGKDEQMLDYVDEPTAQRLREFISSSGAGKDEGADTAPGDPADPAGAAGAQPQSAAKPRETRTAGTLLSEFRTAPGFGELKLTTLANWLTNKLQTRQELKMSSRLNRSQVDHLTRVFHALAAVRALLEQDREAHDAWTMPKSGDLVSHPHERNLRVDPNLLVPEMDEFFGEVMSKRKKRRDSSVAYVYAASCGHVAIISHDEMMARLGNENTKVSPFYRICDYCQSERVALLAAVPDSAQPDSICPQCGQPAFRSGEYGHNLSRRDLWENLLSDVMEFLNLPWRLRAENLSAHRLAHKDQARSLEAFLAWKTAFEFDVSAAISQTPELGATLKPAMEDEIRSKAAELGLNPDELDKLTI